jgi:cysteine desulfuration protein SufE
MAAPTLQDALDTLALLPDWEQRYTYLIELARHLPPMPEAEKTPEHLVKGCTSQVWLVQAWQNNRLHIQLESDALIVKGLMALVWLAYHGKTQAETTQIDLPTLLEPAHLLQHLSPNRRNGFASVVAHIKAFVQQPA